MTTEKKIQKIVDELKYEIILGHLRPHDSLVEDVLIERFRAKRHVVRRAISDLVDRGIVVKPMGHTARVRFFSAAEVEQMYTVRVALHTLAIQVMPFPVPGKLVALLRSYQKEHAKAVEEQDSRAIYVANEKFHETLFAACQNPYLIETIQHYEWLSNPVRSYGIGEKDIMRLSIRDHKAMIDALLDKDRVALRRLVTQHVVPGKQVYLRILRSADRLFSRGAAVNGRKHRRSTEESRTLGG